VRDGPGEAARQRDINVLEALYKEYTTLAAELLCFSAKGAVGVANRAGKRRIEKANPPCN